MLGNFSFGDYFKQESIAWGWEYVTEELGLPKDRLYVSTYEEDDEAFQIWRKLVPTDRIYRMGAKDNFWNMGPTGPCGPCSEIYYDFGKGVGCGRPECDVGCDCDRYLEIWNHVFTQFDRQVDGSLRALPKKNIDTGMGLERIAAVMQGVTSNFETDLLKPIIDYAATITGIDPAEAQEQYRVVADHIRALTFLISDGVLPSNEGRGYVERRVLRRAVQRGRELGMREPFLYRIVGAVVDIYKKAYPELEARRERISKIVKTEEERFSETLTQGLAMLEEIMHGFKESGSTQISGQEIFRLYDTYGFPVELTEEIAVSEGFTLDKAGFEAEMQGQRERARAAFTGYEAGGDKRIYAELAKELPKTQFVGYTDLEAESKVLALLQDGAVVESASADSEVEVVLDVTPFYAEEGGQVGDKGVLETASLRADVLDTREPVKGLYVHRARLKEGSISAGQSVHVQVDEALRRDTAAHHSGTHLLQAALRAVLGEHVYQAGSLVAPDRFRFDYSHYEAPDTRQLRRVEALVNQWIRENMAVRTEILPFEEAKTRGAIMLFGEKYGDKVRLVQMGDISKELCGGTHVHRSGDIGLFFITGESSISAGMRRIEAVCGSAAYKRVRRSEEIVEEAEALLNVPREEISNRVRQLLEERKRAEKELARIKSALAADRVDDLAGQAVDVDGIKVVVGRIDDHDANHLRQAADSLKAKLKSGVVVLGGVSQGKVLLIAGVTKDLTDRVHAGNLLKDVAKIVGGGGGGRPDMAQAGGKDPAKLGEALREVPNAVGRMIKSG
jgi:alanyl-tRNA synthetase